jgi:hypothetical protein
MIRRFVLVALVLAAAVFGMARSDAFATPAPTGGERAWLSTPGCDSPCHDCDGNCSTNIVCQNQCGSASSPSMMPTTDAPRSYGRPLPMASWILSLPGATGAPPTPPPRL